MKKQKLTQNPTKFNIFLCQSSENPLNFRFLSLNKWTVLRQFNDFKIISFVPLLKMLLSYSCTLFIFARHISGRKKSISIIFSRYCTMRNVFGVRSFLALFLYPCAFSDLCIIHKNKIPVQHEKWNILLYRNIYLCLLSVFLEGLMGVQLLKNLWISFQLLNYC